MESVKDYLLRQKLSNYGYDWKDFRRLAGLKVRLKDKIRAMSDSDIRRSLAKAGILGRGGRLMRVKGKVSYTTGQSFNKELLNMLSLGASRGKKSFWERQERWG